MISKSTLKKVTRKVILCNLLWLLPILASGQVPDLLNVDPLVNPTPGLANLWVDTNGGTCTRSATRVAWNDASACSSMQTALTASQGGDVVVIKNGTYGNQSLSSGEKASVVSFFAETREQALIGNLSISVDKVHVAGIISSGSGDSRGTLSTGVTPSFTDITIDGYRGAHAFLEAKGLTVKNSEFGNANGCALIAAHNDQSYEDAVRLWSPGGTFNNVEVNWLHNIVHDYAAPPDGFCTGTPDCPACSGAHTDCIQFFSGGVNVQMIGNKFYGCPTADIQAGGGQLTGWVVENNYFGSPVYGGNGLSWGQASSCTMTFRNNVYNHVNVNNSGCSSTTFTATGNIFSNAFSGLATGSITGDYNVFPSSGGNTYGTNAKRCTPTWLNGTPSSSNGYDIRLSAADTCAKDYVPSGYSTTDMFGTSRPQGSAGDAGAYEYTSGAGEQTRNSTRSGGKVSGKIN